MGIKLFSSKKFKTFIWILTVIVSLVSFLEIIIKFKILKGLLSLLKWTINLKIPDFIFIIIILALLIWLFLINRKLKELSQVYKGEPQVDIKEEVEKIKLDKKREYVLLFFADAPGEEKLEDLYDFYKGEFGEESIGRLEFNIIINDLEKAELIRLTGTLRSGKFYVKTSKGLDVVKEIL
ncbi:hypothetical protein LCGC14_2310010 [marine sediment metagenome]|uniref:Uncharacterized protein n=1 Tax=marine sediment metagenome TaxID=412755 RepID=A0A0F9FFT3_9ZZZZ|nr:hypothetical protein [Candidatus Aminicenantes bacterium]